MNKKVRGLAWDNAPADYMTNLLRTLASRGIELEVCQYEDDFYAAFDRGGWSFVVIDLLDQSTAGSPPTGLDIARYVANASGAPRLPIFVLTSEMQLVVGDYYKQLPIGAVLSFKIGAALMALNIQRTLEQFGVFVDHRKIFLVTKFADDGPAPYGARVVEWLKARGIEVVVLNPAVINAEIVAGLVAAMNTCGAVIVICSGDDELAAAPAGRFQPRPNVILELGIAVGLSRGLERLVILREKKALMPSDIAGVLRLDFATQVDECFDKLADALRSKGIDFA